EGDVADMDLLGCAVAQGRACVMLLAFRNGMNMGTRPFFPRRQGGEDAADVLAAFLPQYYLEQRPPHEIIPAVDIGDTTVLEEVLTERAGLRVRIRPAVRGDRARFLELAQRNAELALANE